MAGEQQFIINAFAMSSAIQNRTTSVETASEYAIHLIDAFAWLDQAPANSIHAVVTDPPYGLVEYSERELAKRRKGRGGVWRIPPAFDGVQRSPLPRFTVLSPTD